MWMGQQLIQTTILDRWAEHFSATFNRPADINAESVVRPDDGQIVMVMKTMGARPSGAVLLGSRAGTLLRRKGRTNCVFVVLYDRHAERQAST